MMRSEEETESAKCTMSEKTGEHAHMTVVTVKQRGQEMKTERN